MFRFLFVGVLFCSLGCGFSGTQKIDHKVEYDTHKMDINVHHDDQKVDIYIHKKKRREK